MKTDNPSRTVLIPAPADGLGREFSKLYAAKGYRIVMVGGRSSRLQTLAGTLARQHGTKVQVIAENPSEKGSASRICRRLKKTGTRVDELLTRDGFRIYGPFTEKDLAQEMARICAAYRPARPEKELRRSGPGALCHERFRFRRMI